MNYESSPESVEPTLGKGTPLSTGFEHTVVALCTVVLPLWARHLAASRNQSEDAVAEMLSAFDAIGPHLDMAARQSHQIAAVLSSNHGGMGELAMACDNELAPVITRLDAQSAVAVTRVLTMISKATEDLAQLAKPFEHEAMMVSELVERMYIGLQYQDRISQMLTLLHEDMERLLTLLVTPDTDPQSLDLETWQARLEARYAMDEQRQNHGVARAVGTSRTDGSETTVF